MQFDRQITITTGASRNDLNWKPQLMTVAELYDRLRNPVRSTETLDAYMHLPKPQQDALKDVGGFVGGSLNSGRRYHLRQWQIPVQPSRHRPLLHAACERL